MRGLRRSIIMKIAIGCDHGGYKLKEVLKKYLTEKGMEITDFGCYDEKSVDYPLYGAKVARSVASKENDFGILICSTGIGISISANKVKGIRAALCGDLHSAEMTRRHNDANVLCLGGHIVTEQIACKIADIFLNTQFEGGERHERRIKLLSDIEENII